MKSVFFRNDDLGWNPPAFVKLLELFASHNSKLSTAAIPMACLEQYRPGQFDSHRATLEVHVHGLTHLDFEGSGKRAEFGVARDPLAARRDLFRAAEIVQQMFPNMWAPIFTPPWNRISEQHIASVREAGFEAISVNGPPRFAHLNMREINVDVDVHTGRAGCLSFDHLVGALNSEKSVIGYMLHHKSMSTSDFAVLDDFLAHLRHNGVRTQFISEVLV